MKENIGIGVVIAMLFAFIIIVASIMVTHNKNIHEDTTITKNAISQFERIDDSYLVYDKDTHVVYIMVSEINGALSYGVGYGYLSPYISSNGKYCRYVDRTIFEIDS